MRKVHGTLILPAILAVALSAVSLGVSSCSKDIFVGHGSRREVVGDISHEMIVLGDKLEDPYTVENMTKALSSLYPTKSDRGQLTPTDYYVRILPKNDVEYDSLVEAGVEMLDHPMDFDILQEGDFYHDPQLPEGDITWQYALVPVDFEFPKRLTYEILDECYLPDHDPSTKADGVDWEMVEKVSFQLTGNGNMILDHETKGGSEKFEEAAPSGRISIVDSALDDEPTGVKGVRVMCNSFVKMASCYTDDEGYYEMKRKFATKIRYRLVFKNTKGFEIGFNLLLLPASVSTLGSHGPKGVDMVVDRNSERKLFTRCAVNNAGYDYWESCAENGISMSTPPKGLRVWLFQRLGESAPLMMQQGTLIDGSMVGKFLGEYLPLVEMFLPDIALGLKGKEDYSSIYAAAIHQFAHGSHFSEAGRSWWEKYLRNELSAFVTSGFTTHGSGSEEDSGYSRIAEMWAYYVETRLYRERYGTGDVFGTGYWFSPQIFLYLDDRGLSRHRIIKALSSDITTAEQLQKKLLSLYPEYKANINQAFARYN